eukprot:345726-Chlamydomonas_euryale.AAC.1
MSSCLPPSSRMHRPTVHLEQTVVVMQDAGRRGGGGRRTQRGETQDAGRRGGRRRTQDAEG